MKKYTDEQQIWIDFEAMVSAETEDAARAIAEEMPIKVLRKIWEYKAPAYLTSNTKGLGLSSFRKKDWVDEVVNLAMSIRAERLAEQAKSRAVNEGLPVSSDGTVMFKVGAVYIKKCEYRRGFCVTPLIGYEHWTIVGLTSCYAYVRNLDGHMSSHTIKRRREGDNVERIYIGSVNGGWLEATDIAVEGALVPVESETQEEEYRDADGDNSHSGEDIPVCVEVEAPANDVETAVALAETAGAIESILKKCTKAEMLRVLSESTNGTRTAKVSTKKCELVSQIARRIVEYRAERKFRELTLDEKYEYLTSQTDKHEVTQVFWCMSGTEFEEIARRLGIDAKGSYAVMNVQSKLMEITESNKAKSLVAAKDVEGLRDARTPTVMGYGLRELCAETGIEAETDRDVSPVVNPDAVSDAVRVIETSDAQIERHDALSKCTDAEKLEVMNICTGGKGKLKASYDSGDDLAWIVLWEIAAPRRTLPKEVKLNEAV